MAYQRSLGLMDRERNIPMADDTIFRIYSMTKPIASVALMQLYERGMFQLLDPVHRYIPEWSTQQVGEVHDDGSVTLVKPQRPMNIRDVLMHTTGLPGGLFPDNPIDAAFAEARAALGSGQTLESVTALLAEHPLKFHPGTHWNYGLSTDIVGRLVEILSGQRFDEYLRGELFEPLGMVDTGFFVPEDKQPRLAACYQYRPANTPRLMEGPFANGILRPRSYLSGAGGLVSTTARLRRLLPDAGQRRAARRTAGARAQDARAHDGEPPPRRRDPAGHGRRRLRRGGLRGRGVRPGLRRRPGPGGHRHGRLGRRVLLGRRRQHRLLGRPGRGPLRRVHDPAVPLGRLPVPGAAARALVYQAIDD